MSFSFISHSSIVFFVLLFEITYTCTLIGFYNIIYVYILCVCVCVCVGVCVCVYYRIKPLTQYHLLNVHVSRHSYTSDLHRLIRPIVNIKSFMYCLPNCK